MHLKKELGQKMLFEPIMFQGAPTQKIAQWANILSEVAVGEISQFPWVLLNKICQFFLDFYLENLNFIKFLPKDF